MKKGKLISTFLAITVLAAIIGFGFWSWNRQAKPVNGKMKEYSVTTGNIEITILSTGIVQPENRVEVKPPVPGRVEEVLVKEGQQVKKGQRLAWMSSTERAALLDAASSKGPDERKIWEEMYRPTAIFAPISGLIIQRNVESGQTLTAADAVVVMSDRLTVKAQVDETDIGAITLKQKAQIVLDAYPNLIIPATVDKVAYDSKTVNNVTTYIVDVLPDEKTDSAKNLIRSGMTANVTFFVNSKGDILFVPSEAVKIKQGKAFVQRKDSTPTGKITETEVVIGVSDGKKTEIISGLTEADIILTPEFRLEGKRGSSSPFSPMGTRPRGR